MNSVEYAGVPVKCHQEIVDEAAETEEIRIVRVPLRPVQELPEPIYLDKSANSQHRLEVQGEIEKVEGQ